MMDAENIKQPEPIPVPETINDCLTFAQNFADNYSRQVLIQPHRPSLIREMVSTEGYVEGLEVFHEFIRGRFGEILLEVIKNSSIDLNLEWLSNAQSGNSWLRSELMGYCEANFEIKEYFINRDVSLQKAFDLYIGTAISPYANIREAVFGYLSRCYEPLDINGLLRLSSNLGLAIFKNPSACGGSMNDRKFAISFYTAFFNQLYYLNLAQDSKSLPERIFNKLLIKWSSVHSKIYQ